MRGRPRVWRGLVCGIEVKGRVLLGAWRLEYGTNEHGLGDFARLAAAEVLGEGR